MSTSFNRQDSNMSTTDNANFLHFGNQISGHSCFLKARPNSKSLYKPFNPNEADFYEFVSKNKDHALLKFIPMYYGTLSLPKPKIEEVASKVTLEKPANNEGEFNQGNSENPLPENPQSPDSDNSSTNARAEWFRNLYTKRFNMTNTRFLKLQDLTSDIESPCMLDLKMGSVPYNSEKFAHQAKKLDQSTSASLKFRICGLQVKNPKTDTEYFRDKYWGREIKLEQIESALALFFYDGKQIRKNLIKHFIQLLKDLADAIKTSVGFKFYSVSLLLIYDSSLDDEDFEDDEFANTFFKDKLKLKLIDFAKSAYGQQSSELDTDLLTGIENLIKCFTSILNNPEIKPYFS